MDIVYTIVQMTSFRYTDDGIAATENSKYMIVVEMTDVFLYLFVIGASPHTHTPTTANYRLAANKTSALENKREGEGGGGF